MKIQIDFSDVRIRVQAPPDRMDFAKVVAHDAFEPAVKAVRLLYGMNVQEYVDLWLYGPEDVQREFDNRVDELLEQKEEEYMDATGLTRADLNDGFR